MNRSIYIYISIDHSIRYIHHKHPMDSLVVRWCLCLDMNNFVLSTFERIQIYMMIWKRMGPKIYIYISNKTMTWVYACVFSCCCCSGCGRLPCH